MEPLVTVAIPTYNHPNGLRRTLGCITGQTYRNLEILVSDNCSPKAEVQQVIQEYVKRDPRITAFRQEMNIGVQSNYWFLADTAKGEYLMYAQDDDWWSNTFIENIIARLEREPGLPLAACPTRYVNCETKQLSELHKLKNLSVFWAVGNGSMGMAVMGIWRRDAYLKLEAREIPQRISGVDHTAAALALLYGGIGVVSSETYHKGYRPRRFGEAFSRDSLYSFRAWFYYIKTVALHPHIPTEKKFIIPAIAVTNLFRACAITGVSVLVSLPDNPVKRFIQSKFYGVN